MAATDREIDALVYGVIWAGTEVADGYRVAKRAEIHQSGGALLLEPAALAAFGYRGFTAAQGAALKIVLGLGAPLLVALLWGAFVAPKAARRLADPARLALEVAIFAMATVALVETGLTTLALIFAVAVTISLILMFAWSQRGM